MFAKKPDGALRFWIDFRALDDLTVKDAMPVPRIDTLLDKLKGALVCSSLDLASGFAGGRRLPSTHGLPGGRRAVRVASDAVRTVQRPATFLRMMNKVLAPFSAFYVVYLDDMLIFSKSPNEHKAHVEAILTALKDNDLVCCKPKCHMFRDELRFLGHVVGRTAC